MSQAIPSSSPSKRERSAQLERLGNDTFDVLVLGGGISGVAAAHVLTRLGYRTALIDSHDFASGTSQESSQMIWGGIKYLEQGHWRLVRHLCRDRNAWVRQYPGRVAPLPFLYPHYDHDPRGLFTMLIGAWVYWAFGSGYAERPRRHSMREISAVVPSLQTETVHGGLQYFDARMIESDARLTLDVLFDAMDAGLVAVNYVEMLESRRKSDQDLHEISARDGVTGNNFSIRAKWIVNTTGVWVDQVNERLGVNPPHRHLFSKGIHIVLKNIPTSGRALTCLSKDRRIFFVVPWGEATLIGTTDTPFDGPPQRVRADAEDVEYLRAECEAKFKMKLETREILNTKAGLRPLLRPAKMGTEDFLALARDHKVWFDLKAGVTALWGGKYTSAFSMGEEIAGTIPFAPSSSPLAQIAVTSDQNRLNDEIFFSNAPEAGLIESCRREMVVTLKDLLRRRTNLALKIANGGWGMDRCNEGALTRLADIVADADSERAKP